MAARLVLLNLHPVVDEAIQNLGGATTDDRGTVSRALSGWPVGEAFLTPRGLQVFTPPQRALIVYDQLRAEHEAILDRYLSGGGQLGAVLHEAAWQHRAIGLPWWGSIPSVDFVTDPELSFVDFPNNHAVLTGWRTADVRAHGSTLRGNFIDRGSAAKPWRIDGGAPEVLSMHMEYANGMDLSGPYRKHSLCHLPEAVLALLSSAAEGLAPESRGRIDPIFSSVNEALQKRRDIRGRAEAALRDQAAVGAAVELPRAELAALARAVAQTASRQAG
jgi:hypothetical protein